MDKTILEYGIHLIHSLGIILEDGETCFLLEKGTNLPARTRKTLTTRSHFIKGQKAPFLRTSVVEGESTLADRSKRIGELTVSAENVKRDLPAGTDVDVTIDVDASRIIRVKAWILVLDEEFETTLELGGQKLILTTNQLDAQVRHEKSRLDRLRKQAEKTGDGWAAEILQRIDRQRMVHDVEKALQAAASDEDTAEICERRLMDL